MYQKEPHMYIIYIMYNLSMYLTVLVCSIDLPYMSALYVCLMCLTDGHAPDIIYVCLARFVLYLRALQNTIMVHRFQGIEGKANP